MRLKHIFGTLFIALSYFTQGQFLHTSEEMEGIILNNPSKYVIQETDNLSLEAFKSCRDGVGVHNTKPAKKANFNLQTEELTKGMRKKLKKRNKKIVKFLSQSENSDKINELCANHYKLGNFDEALFYKLEHQAAVGSAFETEFFLAKSYYETKKPVIALDHILNAKILLPYADQEYSDIDIEMVEKLLQQILQADQKSYEDWNLNFSYCVTTRDQRTYISFKSEPWKHYAMCKTVWREEPNHKVKMSTISDQAPWLVEEKECLLNALVVYMRNIKENNDLEGIAQFAKAIDNNYIREYIQYETFVAKYQRIPAGLPNKEEIQNLKRYFLKGHSLAL